MTTPAPIKFKAEKGQDLTAIKGNLVVFTDDKGKLGPAAAAVDAAAHTHRISKASLNFMIAPRSALRIRPPSRM